MTARLQQFLETMAADASDDLTGDRCLVLAPHPDDEVLGCGGTIIKKIRQGREVWIMFLTDGRKGISGPRSQPGALREAEAIHAAEILGLSKERLVFLGFEDGRLREYVHEAAIEVQRFAQDRRVQELFVPYQREFHADHQAAWAIADACRQNGLRVLEYPIWFGPWLWNRLGWKSRIAAAFHLLDLKNAIKVRVTDVVAAKHLALRAYRSQLSALEVHPWGSKFLANFLGDYELFFERPQANGVRSARHRSASRTLATVAALLAKSLLPVGLRRWLRSKPRQWSQWPPVGLIRFGQLRRTTPISRSFGFDRGKPVDRYYIEQFLSSNAAHIQGRVLEIGDNEYTRTFGGPRVTKSDVLHVTGNDKATIVGDLTSAEHIPSGTFDCIILTQTLNAIYDVRAAMQTVQRMLTPGGVLLATVPSICQISWDDMNRWGDYWRLTTLAARKLFEEFFPASHVHVQAYGNVLAAVAFLHGLGVEDLRAEELDHRDPDYELTVAIKAVKPED